jgi:hypothetical protein
MKVHQERMVAMMEACLQKVEVCLEVTKAYLESIGAKSRKVRPKMETMKKR